MSKSDSESWKVTGIASKFPTYRNSKFISTYSWLLGKQEDDGAEGLWRIHDTLYDFTEFIERHPGGSFWISESQGTDITEAFEAHHISLGPEKLLPKYKVREAKTPRIYNLTINEGGFYKTLKSRVRDKLKDVDHKPAERSDLFHTGLLIATFAFAIASAYKQSLLLAIPAAVALCWVTIAAHNYFHRRDNWRMYTFNLSLMNFSAWRVSHALSHHIYPNSLLDLELSMFEPMLCWLPSKHFKTDFQRYASVVIGPVVYMLAFVGQMVLRIIFSLKWRNVMYWHDVIGLSIPLAMFIFSDLSLFEVIRKWMFIELLASFCFGVIGLNAAHHEPEIYHDGDANREDRDWGLFQVDTITDRGDLKGSPFLVLTHFGDHALHHLFPTLDHGILPQLYPIFYETLDQFKGHLRELNHIEHIIGQHKQLLRITPNRKPPGNGNLLLEKQEDDGAEGLWRIHDTLYDFTEFIERHPGGSFWISESQGTDITEAFEAHHISLGPEKLLPKYKVREAKTPRIYNLTINEGGFYKTLKSRVRDKLKDIDHKPAERSDLFHTGLLIATFAFAIASAYKQSLFLAIPAAVALCWVTIAAHNYFHRKDNWRMYTFNLSLMNFSAWRVSHALSHHIYPNSLLDLELSMFEPMLCWLPSKHFKTDFQRYASLVIGPVAFVGQMVLRIIFSLKWRNVMYWHDVIGLSIPLAMFIFSDLSLFEVIRKWMFIELLASFCFGVIGLNAAHHEPEIYHDGDANREDRDWGLFQVDTITDRGDLKGSPFLVLTHFGDHALHHLFPTLDHGILPQLYPIFYETLDQFKGHLRELNHIEHIIGQHKQLLRITPNKKHPGDGK